MKVFQARPSTRQDEAKLLPRVQGPSVGLVGETLEQIPSSIAIIV